jgi:hypothetical protein
MLSTSLSAMIVYTLEMFPKIVYLQFENATRFFGDNLMLERLLFKACSPVLDSIKLMFGNASLRFVKPENLAVFIRNVKNVALTQENTYTTVLDIGRGDPSYLQSILMNFKGQAKMETLQIRDTFTGTCICEHLQDIPLFSIINQFYQNIALPTHCQILLNERKMWPVRNNWPEMFDICTGSDFYRAFISFLLLKESKFPSALVIYIFSFLPKIMTLTNMSYFRSAIPSVNIY